MQRPSFARHSSKGYLASTDRLLLKQSAPRRMGPIWGKERLPRRFVTGLLAWPPADRGTDVARMPQKLEGPGRDSPGCKKQEGVS